MWFSQFIIDKYPSLEKNKPGVEFLFRLFFLIVIGIVLKKTYWLVSDVAGTITKIPFLGGINLIETVRTFLLNGTVNLLHLLGHKTLLEGWVVGIKDIAYVRIETPCLGINVCLVFILLVLAYPAAIKWYEKALFLVGGVIFIQFVNLIRMVAMVYVVKNRYNPPIEHHDLFNMVIYLIVFGLFYWLTVMNTKRSS
jgi:exosortase/archaeosortase family protein